MNQKQKPPSCRRAVEKVAWASAQSFPTHAAEAAATLSPIKRLLFLLLSISSLASAAPTRPNMVMRQSQVDYYCCGNDTTLGWRLIEPEATIAEILACEVDFIVTQRRAECA